MSKPANNPTISAPTTPARANENGTKTKNCNRMPPPSSPRYTYKPAIPWAYASLPPSQLTTYLDDKKKPAKKAHLAVRIVQSHFLLKLPAILAVTLALAYLQAAIRNGHGNDGNDGNAAAPTAFLRNLLHGLWVAFAFQAAVAAPSALLRSELLFDLSGAACFVTVVAGALGSTASANRAGAGAGAAAGDWAAAAVEGARAIGRAVESCDGRVWEEIGVDWRQGWVSALVCVWAVRRGIFTFVRALCRNGDSRFDEFRANRKKFFAAFMMQSVWVTFCAIPVVALNSIPAQGFIGTSWQASDPILSALTSSGGMLWFWLGVWAFFRGLMIECVADWQLTKWRLDKYRKRHDEVFCRRGLWERSRHPNYYGEWLLWSGISMCCSAVLLSSAARNTTGLGLGTASVLCAVTPYFVYKTLRNISIPLIEEKYDKMYMERKDYRDWRRNRTFRLWLDGSGIIWGYF